MVVPLVVEQSLELFVSLPEVYADLRQYLVDSSSMLLQNIGYNLPADPRMMMQPPPLESGPLDAVTRFTGFIGTLVNSAIMAIAVILLTSFWVLESERAVRSILLIIPLGKREQAREFLNRLRPKLEPIRGQLILCLSIGVMALIVYMILGLPNAWRWRSLPGFLKLFPYLVQLWGPSPRRW
jgi:predicted PurR-regulated permease PerM